MQQFDIFGKLPNFTYMYFACYSKKNGQLQFGTFSDRANPILLFLDLRVFLPQVFMNFFALIRLTPEDGYY